MNRRWKKSQETCWWKGKGERTGEGEQKIKCNSSLRRAASKAVGGGVACEQSLIGLAGCGGKDRRKGLLRQSERLKSGREGFI